MRVYLYLLLSGRTCNWLYALSTRITLHDATNKIREYDETMGTTVHDVVMQAGVAICID